MKVGFLCLAIAASLVPTPVAFELTGSKGTGKPTTAAPPTATTASGAATAGDFSLAQYSCQSFIEDIAQKADGERVWRATMLVAWGVGYASAYQKSELRMDARAFKLIGGALGAACRGHSQESAARQFVGAIDQLISSEK
jgi:hypothetical protein